MARLVAGKSRMDPVRIDGVEKAFIIRNKPLENILFNRNLIGLEFTKNCELASEYFLRHFRTDLGACGEELAELMLLSKGQYYWLHNAFAKVFHKNLQINFAGSNRVEVVGGSVKVAVPYVNFDAATPNLVIGDTLASGETICTALTEYLKMHPVERVFVFCIAGSIVGGKRLANFCRERGIDLTLAYGLAAFGLGDNGFDLSFLNPTTITNLEYVERAEIAFRGRPISAAGWDFGSQAQAVRKYKMLCSIEAEYWDLAEDTELFAYREKPDQLLVRKEQSAYSGIADSGQIKNPDRKPQSGAV